MTDVQVVTVRIPKPLLGTLDAITDRQRRTRHATILVALEQYVKRNAATGAQPGSGTPSERVSLNGNPNVSQERNRG